MKQKFNRGFTLIELMVTVAIVAILAAIAVPNLTNFLINSQSRAAISDLTSSMALARSEAIKRAVPVRLQSATKGTNTLQNGWVVFVDADGSGTVPATGANTIIEVRQAYATGTLLMGGATIVAANGFESLRFDAAGRFVRDSGAAGAASLGISVMSDGVSKSDSCMAFDWGGRSRIVKNQLPPCAP
jgi:type IV fimbrial biogenesis protein FimT